MKTESAINQFQMGHFQQIVSDLAEANLGFPGAGHGHSPMWILGHLAITGEIGQKILGGNVTHRDWLRKFGIGSCDDFEGQSETVTKSELVAAVTAAYEGLRNRFDNTDDSILKQDHQLKLFEGTPIRTIEHAAALMLTNHFAFHLAQLSALRRQAGFEPLF